MIDESFMKSIFHGVIAEGIVFPYPEPKQAEVDNLNIMLDSVKKYCAKNVDSAKIDREHHIPDEVIAGLKALGLFGLNIPQEYGGIGLGAACFAACMQLVKAEVAQIARASWRDGV
jgi:acyl-CoA dehydrogenase family protein 9